MPSLIDGDTGEVLGELTFCIWCHQPTGGYRRCACRGSAVAKAINFQYVYGGNVRQRIFASWSTPWTKNDAYQRIIDEQEISIEYEAPVPDVPDTNDVRRQARLLPSAAPPQIPDRTHPAT